MAETSQTGPITLKGFIGQERIKNRLRIAIDAAKLRGDLLCNILLVGESGMGKETLATTFAVELGRKMRIKNGCEIGREGDLAGLLTNLTEGDILLIEEINRLPRAVETYLVTAAKNFRMEISIDEGRNPRTVHLNIPRFTLIGTVTQKELLSVPLLSCFQIIEKFAEYSEAELAALINLHAQAQQINIEKGAAGYIAFSSDRTPRDALNRLRHVHDFNSVRTRSSIIFLGIAAEALKLVAVNEEIPDISIGRIAISSEVRREVWRRDGGKCAKCGSRKKLEYDHIIPVIRGGSNTARNIELLCESCNRSKSDSIE